MNHLRGQEEILVLGLGNTLLRDEGLGVRTLERLGSRYRFPDQVRLMDGGTRGLDLLPYLAGTDGLLIIDAVNSGDPPGTLMRFEGQELAHTLSVKMSVHQVGMQELLAAAELSGTLPRHVVLWGMQPAKIAWGEDLSTPVASAMDRLVQAVAAELKDWGVAGQPIARDTMLPAA